MEFAALSRARSLRRLVESAGNCVLKHSCWEMVGLFHFQEGRI